MFEFNTLVILSDKKDKQYMITLKEGARTIHDYLKRRRQIFHPVWLY